MASKVAEKKKAAAYCRVSTDSDEQATSYEAQIEHYTEYIKSHPEWTLAGIFADDGISGTNTKKREELYEKIIKATPAYGIGQASAKEIDEINILQASFLAMRRAYDDMIQKGFHPTHSLIDGNRLPQSWPVPAQAIIGGDGKSLSIAAASILAKVYRDRLMTQLGQKYPAYGWEKNAGYGTKQHQKALSELGITPYHRLSYAPIRRILEGKKD